ncbi:hypothetical protein [Microtetraspora malaysiensis]|uniref:hypothetical protein n=1 Tax=Microtetraspora malaysiensis TaxID=161358 RepID=UPI003D8CC0DF
MFGSEPGDAVRASDDSELERFVSPPSAVYPPAFAAFSLVTDIGEVAGAFAAQVTLFGR